MKHLTLLPSLKESKSFRDFLSNKILMRFEEDFTKLIILFF
jgi:hypothetical protein